MEPEIVAFLLSRSLWAIPVGMLVKAGLKHPRLWAIAYTVGAIAPLFFQDLDKNPTALLGSTSLPGFWVGYLVAKIGFVRSGVRNFCKRAWSNE